MTDDDEPATPEEKRQAEALARALKEGDLGLLDPGDRRALGLLGALRNQGEAPLGELRARSIAQGAVRSTEARSREARSTETRGGTRGRRHWVGAGAVGFAAAAAALLIAFSMRALAPSVPVHLSSRSAGNLVPGPFPASQTAAARLDVVAADRLVAYRELSLRGLAEGRR